MEEYAILFDAGGVLLLPDGDVISLHAETLGIAVTPHDAVRAMALADREIDLSPTSVDLEQGAFARFWGEYVGCSPAEAEELWLHLEAEVPTTVLWSRTNDEAVRLFAELPQNIRRYVVSNAEGMAYAELIEQGLSPHVEGVLDSGAVGVEKPDARIFEMAAVALGIPLTHCVYVGDTIGGAPAEAPRTVLYDRFDVFAHHPPAGCDRIRELTELTSLFADDSWRRRTFDGADATVGNTGR